MPATAAAWSSGKAAAAGVGAGPAAGDGDGGGVGLLPVCSESQRGTPPARSQRLLPLAELKCSMQALNALGKQVSEAGVSALPAVHVSLGVVYAW